MRHFTSAHFSRRGRRLAGIVIAVIALVGLAGCHRCQVYPTALAADPTGNGVFEPGETVQVAPAWHYASLRPGPCSLGNLCPATASLSLYASDFTGPAGAVYTIVDDTANYGAIPLTQTRNCNSTGDCYQLAVSNPGTRPAGHWDTTFVENSTASPDLSWILPMGSPLGPESCPIQYSVPKTWTLHIGKSFSDVATSNLFYAYIENLFHNGITAGCSTTKYCPDNSIRRDQMAVFLLKAEHGASYLPPPCGGRFADVPCPGPLTDWVEQINSEGIIADCGGGNFCPGDTVTRRDMAAWLLKARYGSGYTPPVATGIFGDVPITDPSAPWIEDLYNSQITVGCNSNPLLYCPDNPNTRGQMAVFVDKTFGLLLYGL